MTLPGQSFTFLDGNGLSTPAAPNIPIIIGPCSAGTINSVYTFGSISNVNSTIGFGQAQLLAEMALRGGFSTVKVIPASGSIAATVSSVVSSSGGTFTVTGTPNHRYDAKFKISKAGAPGTGMFQYRLDGDDNSYSDAITIPGTLSYPIPNTGLTMSFGAASYTLGQTATFTTKPKEMTTGDLDGAHAAIDTSFQPLLLAYANHSLAAASGSALFTDVDTELTTLKNKFVFTYAVLPSGGDTTDVPTKFSGTFATPGNGIEVVGSEERVLVPTSFVGFRNPKVPYAYLVVEKTAVAVAKGGLATSEAAYFLGGDVAGSSPTYDENASGEVYNLYNIVAPRTFAGSSLTYPNQSWVKSPVGSDYRYSEWVRVMNYAASIVEIAQRQWINRNVNVLTDGSGNIDPSSAAILVSYVQGQLNSALVNVTTREGRGLVSAVQYSVDLTTDVLTTGKLTTSTQIVPKGKVTNVLTYMSFVKALPAPSAS